MSKSPVAVTQSIIHHAAALRVVQAALAQAETLGISVCVAVVDSVGRLAGFARMPGAFLISGEFAIKKAHDAAALGIAPDVVEQALAQEAPRVREGIVLVGGFNMVHGGLPLRFNEALVGAVGVSGGSEAQDVTCAQAGVAALLSS